MPDASIVTEPEVVVAHERLADASADELLLEDELLVEDVSIDGMCGVY
jgi:mycofactocin precursor